MGNLRDFVACVERLGSAASDEEYAEAKSDLLALSNRSVGCAIAVALARIYFERPAVLPLTIGASVALVYFNVGRFWH